MPAIIYSSHAGMFLGTAIAKTISGENNPAGRTPQTWYKSEHDLSDIMDYDIETAGTTYMYFRGEPLYPFGHGLSYSKFEYSNLNITGEGADLHAELTVRNVSERDGDEVIQIYYTVKDSEIIRPIKKLCGFTRANIKAASEKRIRVKIMPRMLEIYNLRNDKNIVEDGDYLFMIGTSSSDIRLEKTLHIAGKKLGQRPCEFMAESYDYCTQTRIKYSDEAGHYIIGTGWTPVAVYEGIDLKDKKSLTVYAATTGGKGRLTVDFDGLGRCDIEIDPSNSRDDFKPYTVDILSSEAKKLTLYHSEGTTVLKFAIK